MLNKIKDLWFELLYGIKISDLSDRDVDCAIKLDDYELSANQKMLKSLILKEKERRESLTVKTN